MIVTRQALSRRTFLRGLGVTLGLPLLDAMVPALTALAQTPARPVKRLSFTYVPHGANQFWAPQVIQWKPYSVGANFEFSNLLKPLEPFRDHVTVISELSRLGTGGHSAAPSGYLGGFSAVKRTFGTDYEAGITIDQVLARKIGQETAFPSLELATEDFTGYLGACDGGLACAYYNTITWSGPTTPLPMDIDPRAVFERLFGRPGTVEQRAARRQQDRSILDSVKEDIADLQRGLGPTDRTVLGDYLTNVREIERRIQQVEAQNRTEVLGDAPVGIPDDFGDHVAILYDLMGVAFQADLTRVATFMMCRELSQRTYVAQGAMSEPHHSMSHHQNDPDKLVSLAKIQNYQLSLFAKFVEKMKNTPDGDGSLLDHSLFVYGSGMGNSNGHTPDNLPLVLVGGAAGRLKGNRHIDAPEKTPLANVWLSVANMFDVPLEKHGNSTASFDLS